jgi:hypothetical protein
MGAKTRRIHSARRHGIDGPAARRLDGGMVEELPAPEDGGAYPELHNLELPLQ